MYIWETLLFGGAATILLVVILACLAKINGKRANLPRVDAVSRSKYNGHVSDLIKDIHIVKEPEVTPAITSIAQNSGNVFDIIRELHANAKS